MTHAFNKDELMDRLDGDIEFLAETVEILDEDGPTLLAEVRAAATAREPERIASAAHAIKGMVSNFCAEPSINAAKCVEEMGRSGNLDGVDIAVTAIEEESARLKTALNDLLTELRA